MKNLDRLTDNHIISALAIDQRGALKRMLGDVSETDISRFKVLISKYLTPYASSILLDPEYGQDAAGDRDSECGLLMAYEKTGYDKTEPGRLPDLLDEWSVRELKDKGTEAIKLLVYIDPDEEREINIQKESFIQRVGSECRGEDIPFFLEIITYDKDIEDAKSREFAEKKPGKILKVIEEYGKEKYGVDVFKVEVPVNMNYVEGYCEDPVYTKIEALAHFKEQSDASGVPFIFLSAGVTSEMFNETLRFAKEAGSQFNGVLCGRATWAGAADAYHEGGFEAVEEWMKTTGTKNIQTLREVVQECASPIK
ncbi:tagatose 1,6-diphosphate aldolase [Corticicoccus populi]|uniref:Tagatose 1,6-diphosphate aldolase n=1 Tax=Corticicoccus populi TaxID=1812821 RepID=A0ABW5X1G2_9STAP